MKYLFLIAVLAFAGRYHAQSDKLCKCHEFQLNAAKEFQQINGDKQKLKAFQEKHKEEKERCEKIVLKMREDLSGLSKKKKKVQQKKYEKTCPAFAELQKMRKKEANKK